MFKSLKLARFRFASQHVGCVSGTDAGAGASGEKDQ